MPLEWNTTQNTWTHIHSESTWEVPHTVERRTRSANDTWEKLLETLKFVCFLKPRDTQSGTSLMLKRELDYVRRELRNFKTGQHENRRENVERDMTADERITHERAGHATYDPRGETCVKVREVSTHPRKAVAEAADFDHAGITKSQQGAEVKILVGAGPRGEMFARAVHRKGTTFKDLEQLLKVLQTRYGNIPVDQEECLREVVHSTAGRLGIRTGSDSS